MAYGKQPEIPQLLQLLFGEAAQAALPQVSQRLLLWCEAFDGWLGELRAMQQSNNYRGALMSWKMLLNVRRMMPWEMQAGDFESFVEALKAAGYAPGTINYSLVKIRSFFSWCERRRIDPACEAGFNPARGVKGPDSTAYERLFALSLDEAQRLLRQIRQDDSDLGRRDYALILARLRLGVNMRSLRTLRWGQIHIESQEVWVDWGAGKPEKPASTATERKRLAASRAARRTALPSDVWKAIVNYLDKANRLAIMAAENFIFAPLVAPLTRGAIGRPFDWDAGRAISHTHIWQTLKRYGQMAGIPKQKLTMKVLQNTAVLLRVELGDDLEKLRIFLGTKANPADTRRYVDKLLACNPPEQLSLVDPQAGPANPAEWMRGPGPSAEGPRRTHGFYASQQLPEAVQAVLAEQVEGIEAELAALRSLGRGLIERMERTDNPAEAARLGQAYSQLAARLGELVRVEAAIARGTETSTHVAEIFELFDMVFTEDGHRPLSEIIMEEIDGEGPGGGLAGRGLAEEIAALRVVLRHTFSLAGQAEEARSYAHLADIYGSGCNRLMRLLRFGMNKAGRIEEAIDEHTKDAIRSILEHDRIRIALGPNTPEGLAHKASLELSEERQKALDARIKAYRKYKYGEQDLPESPEEQNFG